MSNTALLEDSFDKGFLFEKYITTLFNERKFKLETWRKSRKIQDNIYPIDMSYPDLELIFVHKRKFRFAVECKWRKQFFNGKIKWVNDYQSIVIYHEFQSRFLIPVFVAIGVGGLPDNPKQLFVTPLNQLGAKTDVYESELIPFNRKPSHRFFYDAIQLRLF